MASSGKRKTTMAKLNRESRLRDKKAIKEARKAERKAAGSSGIEIAPATASVEEEYFGRIADDPLSV